MSVCDSMPFDNDTRVLVAFVRTKAILGSSVQGWLFLEKCLPYRMYRISCDLPIRHHSVLFSAFNRWHNGKAAHENVVITDGNEGAVSYVLGVCLSTNVNKW